MGKIPFQGGRETRDLVRTKLLFGRGPQAVEDICTVRRAASQKRRSDGCLSRCTSLAAALFFLFNGLNSVTSTPARARPARRLGGLHPSRIRRT